MIAMAAKPSTTFTATVTICIPTLKASTALALAVPRSA
jgi:hypothetical protein